MFIGILTLGVTYFCREPVLSTPLNTLLQIFQPLVLIFLIAIIWLLSRNAKAASYLQQLQRRKLLLHVLWLIMLIVYTNITFVSMGLLACVPLGNTFVLHLDGSVKCFQGKHLPYGILSIVILFVFVVLPPLLILWPRVYTAHQLKGLVDEATHIYRDNCRWWVSFNLLRRPILSAVSDWVRPGYPSHIAITITLLAFLFAQDLVR